MNREKNATVVLDYVFRMKYLFRIHNSMALTMFKVEVMSALCVQYAKAPLI